MSYRIRKRGWFRQDELVDGRGSLIGWLHSGAACFFCGEHAPALEMPFVRTAPNGSKRQLRESVGHVCVPCGAAGTGTASDWGDIAEFLRHERARLDRREAP